MTALASWVTVARSLRIRAGTTAVVLLVAVVAVAAAVAGPTYDAASETSILHDGLSRADVLGRGYEVVQSGSVAGPFAPISDALGSDLGVSQRLFAPSVEAREGSAYDASTRATLALVWRSGACTHLVVTGRCAGAPGEVVVSRSLARVNDWHIGQQVAFPTWGTLTVTGTYAAPGPADDYWLDRQSTYFPFEYPPAASRSSRSLADAMFTPERTLTDAPGDPQGQLVVDDVLQSRRVTPGDVPALDRRVEAVLTDSRLVDLQAVAVSDIPPTLATVRSGWSSLAVPVLLVTLQLLALAWLLLFLLVSETIAARGPEIALAKLRGFGARRAATFALSEPLAVLALALPCGAAAGWGASAALGRVLLLGGTPIGFPAVSWLAAIGATIGGAAAVGIASLRTIRRPVIEQWRRAGRAANARSWALDAIVLTAAAAGVGELLGSGTVTSAHRSALSLLVPGLMGVAVAVVASRLLPLACGAALGRRRESGLATFLALRHVARRPGGSRTTIMLTTAFALATFALSAWSVGRSNFATVAGAQLGAPTVLTVSSASGADVGDAVAAADPGGRLATPVEIVASNGATTLAVDPTSWARIATWHRGPPSKAVIAALDPPAAPTVTLAGDAVRIQLSVTHLSLAATGLTMDVQAPTGEGLTPVDFPALPTAGPVSETAPLESCPCRMADLALQPDPTLGGSQPLQGSVTVQRIEVHDQSGWHPVGARLTDPSAWGGDTSPGVQGSVTGASTGLQWSFSVPGNTLATLRYLDRPFPLPALASSGLTAGRTGAYAATGLDGENLPVQVVAALHVVPGAPADGVVVDRRYADIAASGIRPDTAEVWVAPGAAATMATRLKAAGLTITSTQTVAAAVAAYNRQGPGLAQVLFLAEAAAAAVLAAGGSILGLYLTARRRRYELAALMASGLSRRTLRRASLLEQVIVLSYGIVTGVATGLVAAAVVLRDVPEFLASPGVPGLATFPAPASLVLPLAAAVVAAAVAGGVAAIRLVAGTRLEQLRESTT